MKTLAKSKNLKISSQKLRLVADMVRNMPAVEAKYLLVNTNKKAAKMVFDALSSAMANAQNNHGGKKDQLVIDEIKVDEGKRTKRSRPRAKGMSSAIVHKSAHLTVIVSDDQQPNKHKNTKPVKKQPKPVQKEKK